MVKLTIDLISKTHKRKPDENINQYLNRITHFYLQDKSIDEVVSVAIIFIPIYTRFFGLNYFSCRLRKKINLFFFIKSNISKLKKKILKVQ